MATQRTDVVFEALADVDRRHVCRYLAHGTDDRVTLDELTDAIARATSSTPEAPTEPLRTHRDDVEVRLHHVHLPKLDAAGIVEYDPEDGVIVPDDLLVLAVAFDRRSEVVDPDPGRRQVR